VTSTLTAKGAATRSRIVEAAADLVLARGVGATTLDDIRAGTMTSKSQLFHYFPGGKSDLIGAIVDFQARRVVDAQRPHIEQLDSWRSWAAWRDAVIAHYASQPHWGCPVGALASELIGNDPARAAEAGARLEEWRGLLEAGAARMIDRGLLPADVDPAAMGTAIFAALQGGLLLTHSWQSIDPLRIALDHALDGMRAMSRSVAPGGATALGRDKPRPGQA
jgi:AcrR family transcriptional regulator